MKRNRSGKKRLRSAQKNFVAIGVLLVLAICLPFVLTQLSQQKIIRQDAATSSCLQIGVPAYFGGTMWDTVAASYPTTTIMIANGNGGPSGVSASPSQIQAAQRKGIKVFGYVPTGNGGNSVTSVEAEIDTWKNTYGISNIFFDEGAGDAGHVSYYKQLSDYVHSKTPGSLTIVNYGWNPSTEASTTASDILVDFEGSYSQYATGYTPASWVTNYPASKFMQLVHHAPDAVAMQNAVTLAQQRHAGYVYVMNDNQWGQIPTYWTQEVADIAASGTCNTPTQPGAGNVTRTPAQQGVTPTPPYATPSFVCAGSQSGICPTTPLSAQPQPRTTQAVTLAPSGFSLPVSIIPSNLSSAPSLVPSPSAARNGSGFLAAILQIFEALLRLLLSLFGLGTK